MVKRSYIGQPSCWTRTRRGEVVCRKCRLPRTPEGHDPCVANLPGVAFACCGHGAGEGYVCFVDGQVIRGHFDELTAEERMEWKERVSLPPFCLK